MADTHDSPADQDEPHEGGYYVYGVVRPADDRVPAGLTGLDEGPVLLLGNDTVAAAVGPMALDRGTGRRAELLAHSKVVDALASSGPVVPIQFGSVMADQEAVLEELLVPNEEYFDTLLEELDGRAQFNLKATYLEDVVLAEIVAEDAEVRRLRDRTRTLPEDAGHADRLRLGQLVARALEHRREHDAAVLLDAVTPFVAASSPRAGHGADQVLDVALLVDDVVRAEFEEQLEGLAETVHERIRLRLVGPLAPYDFVGGE